VILLYKKLNGIIQEVMMEKSDERLNTFIIFAVFMVTLLFMARVISLVLSQNINFRMRLAFDFKTKGQNDKRKMEDKK
jgi:hypothetical protein